MGSSPKVLDSPAVLDMIIVHQEILRDDCVKTKLLHSGELASLAFLGGLAAGCYITYNVQLVLSSFLSTTELNSPNVFYFYPLFTSRIVYWLNFRVR